MPYQGRPTYGRHYNLTGHKEYRFIDGLRLLLPSLLLLSVILMLLMLKNKSIPREDELSDAPLKESRRFLTVWKHVCESEVV